MSLLKMEDFESFLDSSDPVSWMMTKSNETILLRKTAGHSGRFKKKRCPWRMPWTHEKWRSHTNSIRSAFRAHRQHCNLKKYPWEPGIFFNPVSSVLGWPDWDFCRGLLATWPWICGVISALALRMAEQYWLSQTLLFLALFFLYSFIKCGILSTHTSPTIQVNARQVQVYPVRAIKLMPVLPCSLCNCPLGKPKTQQHWVSGEIANAPTWRIKSHPPSKCTRTIQKTMQFQPWQDKPPGHL